MKRWCKIGLIVDAVALVVLFALMLWFNGSTAHGVAALSDLGGFVVSLALFGAALLTLVILGIVAFVTRNK